MNNFILRSFLLGLLVFDVATYCHGRSIMNNEVDEVEKSYGCSVLKDPQNGNKTCTPYKEYLICHLKCKEGYRGFYGNSQMLQCGGGNWNPQERQVCYKKLCDSNEWFLSCTSIEAIAQALKGGDKFSSSYDTTAIVDNILCWLLNFLLMQSGNTVMKATSATTKMTKLFENNAIQVNVNHIKVSFSYLGYFAGVPSRR